MSGPRKGPHRGPPISNRVRWSLLLLFGTIALCLYLTLTQREKAPFDDVEQLYQDDPCLIDYIRTSILIPPPHTDKYNGKAAIEIGGNTQHIMAIFNNKTNGFFIECGANDGVFLSNTLPLEVWLNWTGILVEPDPVPFGILAKNRRNAWISHSCMSLKKYPTTVSMLRNKASRGLSFITKEEETDGTRKTWVGFNSTCFPFYSFLLAIGRTEIDYMALDVERSELGILSTIPWDKVFIKAITVEVHKEFVTPMRNYMESIGYMYVKYVKSGCCTHDQLYIHPEALNELSISAVITQIAYPKRQQIKPSNSSKTALTV